VTFEGRAGNRDAVAVARLSEAYTHAGLSVAQFYPEPVAATLSWLHGARRSESGIALTVDFGGGTLDLAVVRFQGEKFEVLDTHGMALGGDRIDQLIFEQVLFPERDWTPADVARAMLGIKLARTPHGYKRDSLVDAIGYAAIAVELEETA